MRGSVIIVTPAALHSIVSEAARSSDGLETGGILLGHNRGLGNACITVAGGPGPRARRSAARFMRDLDHAQALADVAYQTDGSIWLGEWHTHVNGPVTPSRYDLRTYRGLLDDEDLRFESLVSLIITTETADWCNVVLHGWIITHSSRGRVRRLAVTSADVGPPKDVP